MKIKIVKNQKEGLALAKSFLYQIIDRKTVLFLSGGKTPRTLYRELAKEKTLRAGAVAVVDERYGPRFHKNSNEKMIKGTGFLEFLRSKKIQSCSILDASNTSFLGVKLIHLGGGNEATPWEVLAKRYAEVVKILFRKFEKKVAILGIGEDGHTAGLPAKSQISRLQSPGGEATGGQANLKSQKYVIAVGDFPGEFKERVTLTFKALAEMDVLLVLAFGSAKQNALKKMFEKGPIEEIPARFYTKPQIASRTILITDQKV